MLASFLNFFKNKIYGHSQRHIEIPIEAICLRSEASKNIFKSLSFCLLEVGTSLLFCYFFGSIIISIDEVETLAASSYEMVFRYWKNIHFRCGK